MSPDSVSSISTANSSAKTSSSKKMFRRGDIRVNGVRLNIAQTLRGVARNINNSLAKIGLLRAEIVSSPKGEKLLIISSKKTLNIRDPQGILSDLFKSKKVGTSDDSMVQITGKGKIGKRIKVIYSNAPEEVVSSLSIFSAQEKIETLHEESPSRYRYAMDGRVPEGDNGDGVGDGNGDIPDHPDHVSDHGDSYISRYGSNHSSNSGGYISKHHSGRSSRNHSSNLLSRYSEHSSNKHSQHVPKHNKSDSLAKYKASSDHSSKNHSQHISKRIKDPILKSEVSVKHSSGNHSEHNSSHHSERIPKHIERRVFTYGVPYDEKRAHSQHVPKRITNRITTYNHDHYHLGQNYNENH